jgi:flagellar M-ring protein FliF
VASSVDGVDAERVMVLDDKGALLSDPYDQDSPAGLASRELKMRSEIEQYLATKAEQLVAQIVGQGNVRVQVSADLNLDRVERTVETVDPELQALSSEQRSEIIPGAEGGAGSTSVSATYVNTRSMETFSGAVGNVRRVTAAVLVNDKLVEGDEGQTYEARTPEELAQIQTLVSNSMGLDVDRGDIINVVSFPFDAPVEIEEEVSLMTTVQPFVKPGISVLALLLTFLLAMRLTAGLKSGRTSTTALPAGKGTGLNVLVGADGAAAGTLPTFEADLALAPVGQSARDKVAAQIEQNPDVAVKLIRTWMRED